MRDSKGRRANPRDKNDEAIDEALLIFSTLSVSAIEEFRKQSNSDSETSNLQCSDAAWSLCNQHAEREREREGEVTWPIKEPATWEKIGVLRSVVGKFVTWI
jgi:hypothetical protein